jgi:hypothetical protein
MTRAEYLRDLADRLFSVLPVHYGIDQDDVDRLKSIADWVEKTQHSIDEMNARATRDAAQE